MKNIAASNRDRLLALSKESGVDFVALLIRFATDRLLYRLSMSVFAAALACRSTGWFQSSLEVAEGLVSRTELI